MAQADSALCGAGSPLETETKVIDGRIQRVYKNLFPSIRMFWIAMTATHGDKPALVFEEQRFTFKDLLAMTLKCAAMMKDVYGVNKGDRVAICSKNHYMYIVSFFACHLLGAVSVLINAWLPLEPLKHCLQLAECTLFLVDGRRADIVDPIVSEFSGSSFLVLDSLESRWKSIDTLSAALSRYKGDSSQIMKGDPKIAPEDDATILFTSGTTGMPKGVLSTQRMLLSLLFNVIAVAGRTMIRQGDPFPPPPIAPGGPERGSTVAIPLFHISGMITLMVSILEGFKVVLLPAWNVTDAVRQFKKERVLAVVGVPTIISDLVDSKYTEMQDIIERVAFGGASISPALVERVAKSFPKAVLQNSYGLTETSGQGVAVSGQDFKNRPASIGIPPPVMDVIIVKDGVKVPTGSPGEIWLRGPTIMKEYWRDPEATAKALTKDGWFRTGDLAVMDDEGFVYIKDRMKDIIIRGGENIDSISVENALHTEIGVMEAVAVGVPDERLGEQVAALVVLKPGYEGKVTEATLLKTVSSLLPKFAIPAMIMVQMKPFELTASGKILKAPLKAKAGEAWMKRAVRPKL